MLDFFKKPMVKIIVPFIGGIIVYHFLSLELNSAWLLCLFLFLVSLQIVFHYKLLLNYKSLFYYLSVVFFFLLGIEFSKLQNPKLCSQHFSRFITHKKTYSIFQIKSFCEEKKNSFRCEAEIFSIYKDNTMKRVEGKVFLYLPKDIKSLPEFNGFYSDYLQFFYPPGESVPGGFSFEKYAFNKNVLMLASTKNHNGLKLLLHNKNLFSHLSNYVRNYCLNKIASLIADKSVKGILNAMLIGADDQIDETLIKSYSVTGTVHILSVSGMHTGIIYAILTYLLSFIFKDKKLLFLRNLIIVIFLWLFVLISGSSPPAIRAALMLSLILLASGINANADTVNVLLFSAFTCLLHDVKLLFDLGFQLSYCAVLGMVFFLQPLKWLVDFKFEFLNKVWLLLCTSFAAQIFTIPIVLFVFHQFPNYFLLSNLIIVPLSGLVMYSGIILCLTPSFHVIQFPVIWFCNHIVKLLNESVKFLADLPMAATENILISPIQAIMLLILLIFIGIAFISRKRRFVFYSLCTFFVFLLFGLYFKWHLYKGNSCLILKQNGETNVYSVSNGVVNCWQSDLKSDSIQNPIMALPNFRNFKFNQNEFNKGVLFFQISNKSILWFKNCDLKDLEQCRINADYIIVDQISFVPKSLISQWKNKHLFLNKVSHCLEKFIIDNASFNGAKCTLLSKSTYYKIEIDS